MKTRFCITVIDDNNNIIVQYFDVIISNEIFEGCSPTVKLALETFVCRASSGSGIDIQAVS